MYYFPIDLPVFTTCRVMLDTFTNGSTALPDIIGYLVDEGLVTITPEAKVFVVS